MTETLRLGFVGVGGVANLMASAAGESAHLEFAACTARSSTAAESFAQKHGPMRVHRDLDSLLADDDVDALYIGTPNALHAGQSLAAINAGKHVLVEKPMALTSAEALELAQAAERENRVLGVGFHLRHHDVFRELKRRIDAGAIGEPRLVRASWGAVGGGTGSAWKTDRQLAGGGSLMAIGVHLLDLVPWLLGDEPDTVMAVSDTSEEQLDTTFFTVLSFPSCLVDIQMSRSFVLGPLLVVHGTEGELRAEHALTHLAEGELRTGDGELLFTATHNPYKNEIAAFAEAVRGGDPFHADGWDGLRCTELTTRVAEAEQQMTGARLQAPSPP